MKPCVLVGSCNNEVISPETIVKGILQLEPHEEPCPCPSPIENVLAYPWSIKTKYYEADINICTMNSRSLGSKEFAESVNAVIICFDPSTCTNLSVVEQWLPFVKEFEPEVKLLVCNSCSSSSDEKSGSNSQQNGTVNSGSGVDKVSAQEWCIDHGFELVELNPTEVEEDDDVEDDFPECLGMKRIIQALHAHLWPNLTLLDKKRPRCNEVQSEVKENKKTSDTLPEKTEQEKDVASSASAQKTDSSTFSDKIDSLLEATLEGSEENFEQLFGKLSEMKLKTEGMSFEERRAYAEKMAISFWKSMGGNDSEIEGLSSDDEN